MKRNVLKTISVLLVLILTLSAMSFLRPVIAVSERENIDIRLASEAKLSPDSPYLGRDFLWVKNPIDFYGKAPSLYIASQSAKLRLDFGYGITEEQVKGYIQDYEITLENNGVATLDPENGAITTNSVGTFNILQKGKKSVEVRVLTDEEFIKDATINEEFNRVLDNVRISVDEGALIHYSPYVYGCMKVGSKLQFTDMWGKNLSETFSDVTYKALGAISVDTNGLITADEVGKGELYIGVGDYYYRIEWIDVVNTIEEVNEFKRENGLPLSNNTDNSNVTRTDENTNVKLEAESGVLPDNVVLEVEPITSGNIYANVKKVASNLSKFTVYDITLKSDGVEVQPNGKVKIKLPILGGYDTSKLVAYRIDGSNKIKYDVTVETIEDKKYATFETDHFSTYVLGELAEKDELDNTPRTGNTNEVFYVLPVAVISTIGIIILGKKRK